MSKKGKAPTPPDPKELASAQTDTNFMTATANNVMGQVNQETPFGTLEYQQIGTHKITDPTTGEVREVPQFAAKQTLSPEQQGILDSTQTATKSLADLTADQAGRLGGLLEANPVEAPTLRTTYGTDFEASRQRVEDALLSRLQPQLDRDRESLRTSLAQQGFREGSEGFDRAMSRFDERANDATMQAVLAGGQEQTRLASLEADRAGFENQAATGQFQIDTASANDPINRIIALLGGSQVQTPSFTSTSSAQVAPVNVAQMESDAYLAELDAYNRNQQKMGGILGIGATLAGAPTGSILGGLFGL